MPETTHLQAAVDCIVIRPELRDSNIEREQLYGGVGDRTIYWNLNAKFPPESLGARFEREGFVGTLRACIDPTVRTVIVPEPMWIRYWPRTVAIVFAARAVRLVRRRGRLEVAFYAIDNLDPVERLTHPSLDRFPLPNRCFSRLARFVLRGSIALIADRIAFGTSDAEQNYRSLGVRAGARGLELALVPEVHALCPRCFPGSEDEPATFDDRAKRLLFLAEFAPRKGVETLAAAWERSTLPSKGWELLLCGFGPLDASLEHLADHNRSITVLRPSRDEVHELLRTSRAVVLPSERVPRWREQIGLSMLEGEAHGCALIVSDESGAAQDLHERANAQVVSAGNVADLAVALDRLPVALPAHPHFPDSTVAQRDFLRDGSRVECPA